MAGGLHPIRERFRLFNEHHFFEAHEVLEDVWHQEHGEPRLFLQGLIQLCAGFHHFQNGNYAGAAQLLKRGSEKMRGYPEVYLGLEVPALLAGVGAARERIEGMRTGREPAGPVEFPTLPIEA